jgi:hypothetical protein
MRDWIYYEVDLDLGTYDVLRGGPAVQVAVDPSVTLRPVRGGK